MAGSTPLFPLRAALLSSALVALLGACTPDRDATDTTPTADPASAPAPAGQPADAPPRCSLSRRDGDSPPRDAGPHGLQRRTRGSVGHIHRTVYPRPLRQRRH